MRLYGSVLAVACLVAACDDADTFAVSAAWLVPPERVEASLPVGAPGFVSVEVANVGTQVGRFTATAEPPFQLADATYTAAPGAVVPVSVFLTPEVAGVYDGVLELQLDGTVWSVPLAITAFEPTE